MTGKYKIHTILGISLILITLFVLYSNFTPKHILKFSFAFQYNTESNKTHDYIKQGDYEYQTFRNFPQAIEWYDKALSIDKDNVEALSKKGNALSSMYDFPKAFESVNKALAIDPNSVIALSNKGLSLIHI